MMQSPVVPLTSAELKELSTPGMVRGGNLEVIRTALFDTALYTGGTTTTMTFFTTARATRQLSNLATPGQLTSPQYFYVHSMGLDVLLPPGDEAWVDVHNLLMGDTPANGGPTWQFTLAGKGYTEIPLTFFHESGGVRGFGFSTASADSVEYARNAFPDGGFPVSNSILIPPTEGFDVTITWPNAVALTTTPVALRPWLYGELYRKIL